MNPNCPKCGKRMKRGPRTPGGKVRYQCLSSGERRYCYSTTNPNPEVPVSQAGKRSVKTPLFKRTIGKANTRLIVTSAQNATPVHEGFLAALEQACNHLNADLVVIPLRYKNPTSRWSASQSNEDVWDPKLVPFLCNERKKLNKNLVLLGDVKTQPTASSPLTGFDAITHGESGILGHTKLQLKTVPTPQSRLPKILTTTGAVTKANYTDSKAGKLGEFHHTLGAALVELDGKRFHLRQLNADPASGVFYDLDKMYSPFEVTVHIGVLALIMGDTHVDYIDAAVKRATFGEDGLLSLLRPKTLVWHDLLDGYAANPHHYGNPFIAHAKRFTGKDDVYAELLRALDFVKQHTPKGVRSCVVSSNHDDFLRRWILSTDWRTDPVNGEFYLMTALDMLRSTQIGPGGCETPSPFAMLAKRLAPEIDVIRGDGTALIGGIEVGMHGDRGPNGSRGSRHNLRRIGVRSVIGHSHSPGIEEGCYQVGTSTGLKMEYTNGPSSWLNTHCVIYPNGKRSLINIIDGQWRAV